MRAVYKFGEAQPTTWIQEHGDTAPEMYALMLDGPDEWGLLAVSNRVDALKRELDSHLGITVEWINIRNDVDDGMTVAVNIGYDSPDYKVPAFKIRRVAFVSDR